MYVYIYYIDTAFVPVCAPNCFIKIMAKSRSTWSGCTILNSMNISCAKLWQNCGDVGSRHLEWFSQEPWHHSYNEKWLSSDACHFRHFIIYFPESFYFKNNLQLWEGWSISGCFPFHFLVCFRPSKFWSLPRPKTTGLSLVSKSEW